MLCKSHASFVPGLLLCLLSTGAVLSQDDKKAIIDSMESRASEYSIIAQEIWHLAEVGYQETKSSALLQSKLREAGFSIDAGVAGMPTAFVASWGHEEPVIGILAEFDALPGLSQDRIPERKPLKEGGAGHACGHHLLGTASTASAIAVREWLEQSKRPGTVRVYGTPAEEGGGGKVYMVRAGLFDDVDAVLHWHPGSSNLAAYGTNLANMSAKFRFHGISAHAASAPDRGRSALDGVEAMNHMVNLLREHVPSETRIHYVITHGGNVPNVVPEFAEVYYYVRHPEVRQVKVLFERVVAAGRGAALGTDTQMEYEIIHGLYNLLANETLSKVVDENLRRVGGVDYTPEEQSFAESIYKTLGEPPLTLGSEKVVLPFELRRSTASTDVGDVSWVVPTSGLRTATWVPGTPAHTWQAVAAGGLTIGTKGMMVAAKSLALTALDLFSDPLIIAEARLEFEKRQGQEFEYKPLIQNRPVPLDYRR